jgi:hypothetical protein
VENQLPYEFTVTWKMQTACPSQFALLWHPVDSQRQHFSWAATAGCWHMLEKLGVKPNTPLDERYRYRVVIKEHS